VLVVLSLAVVLSLSGCCCSTDAPLQTGSGTEAADHQVTLVFAASFDSGGGCHRDDHSGCDLYRARVDLDDGQVQTSERLTAVADTAEWFPSLDASGELVLYEQRVDRRGQIAIADLATGTTETLFPGRYPDFDHQGERFVYSTKQRELRVMDYTRDAGGFRTTGETAAGAGRDPQFHPDGGQLIFHVQPDGETTRTALADLASGERSDFSEPDRCAHAAVSPSGIVGVCSVHGTIYGRHHVDGAWGALEPLATPPAAADLGERFRGCGKLSYGYPEFCGDDDHVVVTLGCGRKGKLRFANLMLVDLATGEVVDLHARLEQAHGVTGTSSATASCSVF
jgi:hypothetical protein